MPEAYIRASPVLLTHILIEKSGAVTKAALAQLQDYTYAKANSYLQNLCGITVGCSRGTCHTGNGNNSIEPDMEFDARHDF